MKYRLDPKSGNQLSVLGFGCMRFSRSLNGKIEVDKAEKLILSAIDQGVNYFDTAYVYGGSEEALGEVLRRNPDVRERMFLATKLPIYQCKRYEDFDEIFRTQLARLNTDYIDYYLLHNISHVAGWEAVRALGIETWLAEKKASGQIRQVGFSFHGIQQEFLDLLEQYPWDFCQIQYNYMNENYQAGRAGLLRAHELGLPVIIMEPLLGGKLAVGLPKKAERLFAETGRSPAAWALGWLWNHREVTVLLSGMNSQEQLDDNIRSASAAEVGTMTPAETETIARAVSFFTEAYKIPCTGCNYCLPCPKGVNIPGSFAAYNVSYVSGFVAGISQYMTSTGATEPAKNSSGRKCVKCGKCEALCPQHIEIMKTLDTVTRRMEPWWFGLGMKLFNKLR